MLLIIDLLLGNFVETRINFVTLDWSSHSNLRKLLNQHNVNVESVFIFNSGLLFLALSLLAATNLDNSGRFAILFILSDHQTTVRHFLGHLFLVGFFKFSGLSLTRQSFVIDDKTCLHLELVQEVGQMVARFQLFQVGVGQVLNRRLMFLFKFLFLFKSFKSSGLLIGHPFNVSNLISLHLMIVTSLPVFFSSLVFLAVKFRDLFINFGDLLLKAIQFLLRFRLLLVNHLQLFANFLHLALKTVFFFTNLGELGTNLFLLIFEFFNKGLNFL